jgi:hypothetical protein
MFFLFLNQQSLLINKHEQLELAQEVHKTKAEDTGMKNQPAKPAITNSSEAQPKTKTRQRQQKTQQN